MVVDDDIEAIERQLASNADTLRSEGIVIARAETRIAPPPEVGDDDAAVDAGGDEDGAVDDSVEPGPTAPVSEPTTSREAEEYAPPADSPPESLARSKRSPRRYSRTRKKKERTRCERICDLAEATCDLAEQICDLADRHVDEVRYEEACERAADQCRQASTACTNCE